MRLRLLPLVFLFLGPREWAVQAQIPPLPDNYKPVEILGPPLVYEPPPKILTPQSYDAYRAQALKYIKKYPLSDKSAKVQLDLLMAAMAMGRAEDEEKAREGLLLDYCDSDEAAYLFTNMDLETFEKIISKMILVNLQEFTSLNIGKLKKTVRKFYYSKEINQSWELYDFGKDLELLEALFYHQEYYSTTKQKFSGLKIPQLNTEKIQSKDETSKNDSKDKDSIVQTNLFFNIETTIPDTQNAIFNTAEKNYALFLSNDSTSKIQSREDLNKIYGGTSLTSILDNYLLLNIRNKNNLTNKLSIYLLTNFYDKSLTKEEKEIYFSRLSYALNLKYLGHHEKAGNELFALAEKRLEPVAGIHLAWSLENRGETAKAIAQFKKTALDFPTPAVKEYCATCEDALNRRIGEEEYRRICDWVENLREEAFESITIKLVDKKLGNTIKVTFFDEENNFYFILKTPNSESHIFTNGNESFFLDCNAKEIYRCSKTLYIDHNYYYQYDEIIALCPNSYWITPTPKSQISTKPNHGYNKIKSICKNRDSLINYCKEKGFFISTPKDKFNVLNFFMPNNFALKFQSGVAILDKQQFSLTLTPCNNVQIFVSNNEPHFQPDISDYKFIDSDYQYVLSLYLNEAHKILQHYTFFLR